VTRYALLLRGVNVGAKNSLPMAALRSMLLKGEKVIRAGRGGKERGSSPKAPHTIPIHPLPTEGPTDLSTCKAAGRGLRPA
jgi:hypothetical protein